MNDDDDDDFNKRLRRVAREKQQLPPPPNNPGRIFIDITTAERFTLVNWNSWPAKNRETNLAPFSQGTRVNVIYVDGPQKGRQTTVEGSFLEEETNTLRTILEYQACNLTDTYNQTYNRFGSDHDFDTPVLLRTFNPYLREWVPPFDRNCPFERVYHHANAYNDLRNQPKDIVRIWIRATGYNIAAMGFLSQADRHFRKMMDDDQIWFEALQFHMGQNLMKFLSLEMTGIIVIDPWIQKVLDQTTDKEKSRHRRYPKRLLELNVRLERFNSKMMLTEKISNSALNETSTTKVPSHIWQCGRHVYALFKRNSSRLPGFLALWDAETEEPFAPPTVRALKPNVLHSYTVCEYITHDQKGFLCYLNDVLTYVVASMKIRGGGQPSSRGIKLTSYPLAEQEVRPSSVFMTPRCIAFDSTLIIRSANSGLPRLEEIIHLPQGATVLSSSAVDRYIVAMENNRFEVRNLLNHTRRDASWRRLSDAAANNAKSKKVFICHYRKATGSLMWFDYSDFCASVLWKWERTPMEGLNLLSTRLLCDACQTEPVSVECGHGCGKAQYCGQECANAHYDIHVADTCDRVSEKK